jgi:hypothetical protein
MADFISQKKQDTPTQRYLQIFILFASGFKRTERALL